jgi:hypothetical protein
MPIEITLDHVFKQSIQGWVIDTLNKDQPLELTLITNAKKYKLLANLYRSDLEDNGIGNHAFKLTLPKHENLITNGFLIVDEKNQAIISGDKNIVSNIYFEIFDLLYYLNVHPNPSGIQNLQLALIEHIRCNPEWKNKVNFCFYDVSGNTHKLISEELIEQLAIERGKSKPNYFPIIKNIYAQVSTFENVIFNEKTKYLIKRNTITIKTTYYIIYKQMG